MSTPGTTPRSQGALAGRSGLIIPLVLAAFATYLAVGNLRLGPGEDFPGPTFFPWILAIAGYVIAALLTLQYLRHPEQPEQPEDTGSDVAPNAGRWRTFSDWPALAWCVGGFLAFALTLDLLGWILAAALLFWCVARGIGSHRPLFDVSLALVVSSAAYLAFSVGLGLHLPSGLLGGGW